MTEIHDRTTQPVELRNHDPVYLSRSTGF
jgi:hypothetical protein